MNAESVDNEQLLGAMVRYLFETGKTDSAKALLTARIDRYWEETEVYWRGSDGDSRSRPCWQLFMRGPSIFVSTVNTQSEQVDGEGNGYWDFGELYYDIVRSFDAVMPSLEGNTGVEAKLELIPVDTDWRSMLLAEIETDKPKNQGPLFAKKENVIIHEGQKFASPAEVEIAKALDRFGVMYFPNCLARVGFKGMPRENKYPDFLVTYKGRWGILEVDGETYHTTATATQDHDRQRILEQHGGIKFFTRYTAKRCLNEPDGVVKEFLGILETK